jgi:glucan biosynthesis protein
MSAWLVQILAPLMDHPVPARVARVRRTLGAPDAEPVIDLSRGEVSLADSHPVVGQEGLYRAFFDTVIEGVEPVNMRMYVRDNDGQALTETWLYQYFPDQADEERKA